MNDLQFAHTLIRAYLLKYVHTYIGITHTYLARTVHTHKQACCLYIMNIHVSRCVYLDFMVVVYNYTYVPKEHIAAMGKYVLNVTSPTTVHTYVRRWQECHSEWYHCWAWRAGQGNRQGLISEQLHPARLQQGQGHHLADQSKKCRLLPLRCLWGHYCGVSHHLL